MVRYVTLWQRGVCITVHDFGGGNNVTLMQQGNLSVAV